MVAIKIKNNLREIMRNSPKRGALGAIKNRKTALIFLSATDSKIVKPKFFSAKTEKPT